MKTTPAASAHWNAKIKEYQQSDWSNRPSPFAMVARSYFPKNAQLLELGAGAGQDSVWFAKQGYDTVASDGWDTGFEEITERCKTAPIKTAIVTLTEPFPFPDASFDVVYSQLALHYFTDEETKAIFKEIKRILKPRGIVAIMVNSVTDPEYDPSKLNSDGLLEHKGITKRYFSMDTLLPFVADFQKILMDDQGRTPKDDTVGNTGMIRFIGRNR